MDTRPLLPAPTSPTVAKRKPKTPVAASVGADSNPRGIAGVDSPVAGDDSTEVAMLPSNPSPGRGLRSSKRLREDMGKDSNAKEPSGKSNTSSKRRKS
jgi:hypothetical protein